MFLCILRDFFTEILPFDKTTICPSLCVLDSCRKDLHKLASLVEGSWTSQSISDFLLLLMPVLRNSTSNMLLVSVFSGFQTGISLVSALSQVRQKPIPQGARRQTKTLGALSHLLLSRGRSPGFRGFPPRFSVLVDIGGRT